MAKTVSLNELTYSTVAVLAGKLTILGGRPISMGMTIYLSAAVLDSMMAKIPELEKSFKEVVSQAISPEEFESKMESIYKSIK